MSLRHNVEHQAVGLGEHFWICEGFELVWLMFKMITLINNSKMTDFLGVHLVHMLDDLLTSITESNHDHSLWSG
jgi:hypothetical protein